MTAYQEAKRPPAGTGAGIKNKNVGQNTHHDKRDTTTLDKKRPRATTAWQEHDNTAW
jgi:hypothetical protein